MVKRAKSNSNRNKGIGATHRGGGAPQKSAEATSTFGLAGLPRPLPTINALARTLTNATNIELIVSRVRGKVGPEDVRATLHEAFCEMIVSNSPSRTWLAEIDRIARSTDDIRELRAAISSYTKQAGVACVFDFPANQQHFLVTGSGDGPIDIVQPAYVDGASGRTILTGRARRTPVTPDPHVQGTPWDGQE